MSSVNYLGVMDWNWTDNTREIRAVPLGLRVDNVRNPGAAARLAKLALPPPWALIGLSLRDARALLGCVVPFYQNHA